jgi:hypothetical protein
MLSKVLDILALFTRLARTFMAKAKAAKAQREADALAENPADWYRGHFSHELRTGSDAQAPDTDPDHHRTP